MSTPQPNAPATSNPDANYRAILEYLTKRGHHKAALALTADLDPASNAAAGSNPASPAASAGGGGKAVGLEDFAERNAPTQQRGASTAPGQGQSGQQAQNPNQRRRPDQSVAPGQMLVDPPSWEKGYHGLRTFVENSLDIHRPELLPLLLPLFVHSYLDLVLVGYREAADHFFNRFSVDHVAQYPSLLRLLSSLRLPQHVSENESSLRWRQERYHVRLSERGWGLVLGWLQGGGLAGSVEGTEGRGRDRVLAIINERVKVDAVPGPPLPSSSRTHGLASEYASLRSNGLPPPSHFPNGAVPPNPADPSSAAGTTSNANGLDGAGERLKLGAVPMNPLLEKEVKRKLGDLESDFTPKVDHLEELCRQGNAGTAGEASTSTGGGGVKTESEKGPSDQANLLAPFPADLPPYPATIRTIDVQREVELVREARKRIRLGAEAYYPQEQQITTGGATQGQLGAGLTGNGASAEKKEERGKKFGKPSVCLFTIHDAGDSLSTAAFSEDSSIMAAGFGESYIRLWSLTGKGLKQLRTDLKGDEVSKINDANDLKKLYHPSAPQTRKLIAHSGPVYSLSFDPVPGPSSAPRYLLSCSADTTIRLWSLETYSNLVVYRGHREPVWDVEWGPRGIYFASASRDRTARLWITDKINAVRIFAGHLSDVNCVTFHPNSLYIATGSSDRTCRLWDVQKGMCVRVFVGHRGAVMKVKISPDGRWLASAGDDNQILLWNLASGTLQKTFTGHTSSIHSLSFSIESTILLSGSSDQTVRVWDVLSPPPESESSTALVDLKKPRRIGALAGKKDLSKDSGKGGAADQDNGPCPDLLATLATKRTPVLEVKFSPRNLALAAGAMIDSS
ncbi:transcription initiation factor TFIID subunit 5 [Sporobolomyces salmoneus]|uniref:transcription initiation factor TFIID subunit 5 n=1 Tax=Sporobolomyces salmoneus TaxID=183962 RepID=UPI00317EB54F